MQRIYIGWSSFFQDYFFDYERIPFALVAIALVSVIGAVSGPLAANANPFYWLIVDTILGKFGDRLDRRHREAATLVFRGLLVTGLALALTFYIAHVFGQLVLRVPPATFAEGFVVSLALTSGAVWFALMRLYRALDKKQPVTGAYYTISRSSRVNLAATDDFGITRSAINYAARSFDKGFVAPLFWYLAAGLPALFIYACLSGLSWRFGKLGFTKGFGVVPLMLERIAGFVPSMLAALILTLATLFTPKAAVYKSLAGWAHLRQAGQPPLTILAWALDLSLGGPGQDVTGSAIQTGWTGPELASAKIDHHRLRQVVYSLVIAVLLLVAGLLAVYLWAKGGWPHLLEQLSL